MPNLSITTPADFGATVNALYAELASYDVKAVQHAAFMAAQMGKAEVIKQIDATEPYAPVDTGGGRRATEVVPTEDGAILQNTSAHMVYMEFGTRPHWVPIAPLLAWAARKKRGMGKPASGAQGPRQRITAGRRQAAIKALAYGAQRRIAKFGTAPRGFWARASVRFPEFYEHALRYEIDRSTARALQKAVRH